jgi:hypothetical protein
VHAERFFFPDFRRKFFFRSACTPVSLFFLSCGSVTAGLCQKNAGVDRLRHKWELWADLGGREEECWAFLALAIRASPNAVGEEATPPEFSFFEAPVYAPGLQSTCVRSWRLETRDRRYLLRSLAEIFSAHGVRNAKRVAYLR